MYVPIPRDGPEWLSPVEAAKRYHADIAQVASEGLSFVQFLGGVFAALAIGAAAISALNSHESDRKQ